MLTGMVAGLPLLLRWPGSRFGQLALLVAAAALARVLWWTVLPQSAFTLGTDEGMYIHGAQRILAGELPNREFFSFFGPVSYAVLALVGLLRGSVQASDARLVAIACGLTCAFIYARLVSQGRRAASWPLYALSFALAIEFETGPGSFFSFSHHTVSLFFSAIAIAAYLPSLREGRGVTPNEVRASGLATSLALMATTNLGVYLGLAIGLWLTLDAWMNGQRQRVASTVMRYWVWVTSLPALYLFLHLANGNAGRLYRELVEYLFVNYANVNAANLDYLFFFRLRLHDAYQRYLQDASLAGLLAALGVNIMVFMGHVPVLAMGLWGLMRGARTSGGERTRVRTTVLVAMFYMATLATTLTNPFVSNINAHALPAFVLLIGWFVFGPTVRPSPSEHSLRPRVVEAVVAVLLVAWAAHLPDWRNAHRPVARTPLGMLTYGSEAQYRDEQQVLSLLSHKAQFGFVAYHYYAPRWYAYFPEGQRLRSPVLIPFYSPSSHYDEAVDAMRRGEIRFAVEDRSFQMNAWDPRIRFGPLEETNGAAFYRYIRVHGREVLSNDTYKVWELTVANRQGGGRLGGPTDTEPLAAAGTSPRSSPLEALRRPFSEARPGQPLELAGQPPPSYGRRPLEVWN